MILSAKNSPDLKNISRGICVFDYKHEMFSNELFVFAHLKPDPCQAVLDAGKYIIQAMEAYDPYSFDNEKTETKLEEIYSLLRGKKDSFQSSIEVFFSAERSSEKKPG